MKRTILAAVLLAGTAMTTPASAELLKFYSGQTIGNTGLPDTAYVGPFSGLAQHTDSAPLATNCPAGDAGCAHGTDFLQHSMTYTAGSGITVTVTANGTNNVWLNSTPNYAGLGAGLLTQGTDADQLSAGKSLTFLFSQPVILTGVETLFSADHTPFGSSFPTNGNITGAMGFDINGGFFSFLASNSGLLAIGGTDGITSFTFTTAGGYNPDLYISSVEWTTPRSVSVPGPVVGAGIPGLISACFGMFGLRTWRRRRNGTV